MRNIPVKIEGMERRRRSTGLLHVVAGFFLIANAGTYNQLLHYEHLLAAMPIYLVALVSLVYGFGRKKLDPQARYNQWVRFAQFLAFAVLGVLMITLGKTLTGLSLFLWAVLTLLLIATERKIFQATALGVEADGIHVPGSFRNHVMPWSIVEELVLRQDYVTILRKDKKFVQLELLNTMQQQDIDEINRYSKEQVAQYSQ